MKKFTTFVVGPLTFIEQDEPDSIVVKMDGECCVMQREDFKDLYHVWSYAKFVDSAKLVPPDIKVEEGEI
jgi:hypothetical protein